MKAPAFQFYPKQWLGDDKVLAMDWDARAMHMHLMCIAWQQTPPCTLPDDDGMLRRWLGNPKKWEVLKNQIFAAWKKEDGRWTQPGLVAQFVKQSVFSKTRRQAANARWIKEKENAYASVMQCENDALQSSTSTTYKVQKPSRAKKARAAKVDPTKTDLSKARHAEFKAIIAEYWDSKNPGVQMPWDGREGKHLEMFLRAAPDITAQQFRGFLRNRFKSEVNHGERASMWIDWVTRYVAGPMDRFGKTIGGENGTTGKNQPSAAKQRVDGNRQVLAEIAIERGWYVPPGAAQPNGEAVPEPRPEGRAARVHEGSGATEPEVLPPRR